METNSKPLTLEKMEEIFKDMQSLESFTCEVCGKKAIFIYVAEGEIRGASCKRHEIKQYGN